VTFIDPPGDFSDASSARKRGLSPLAKVGLLTVLGVVLGLIARLYLGPAPYPVPHSDIRAAGVELLADSQVRGYHGQATNTNTLSPAWNSGVATAWTLDIAPSAVPAQLLVEGSTLYVLTYGIGDEATSTLSAYDISGVNPTILWTTSGPKPDRILPYAAPASASTQDHIFFSGLVVDRESSTLTAAPWGAALAMGVVDDILVTCDTVEACAGWQFNAGEWTQLWSATTSPQSRAGLSPSLLTTPASAVVGSGDEATVVVPVDVAHEAPQVVHPRTGEVTTLGEAPAPDGALSPMVTLASDGVLVSGEGSSTAYSAAGAVVGTYEAGAELTRVPAADGRVPTLEELGGFLTSGVAPWTTASVQCPGSSPGTALVLTLTPTDGGDTTDINPGDSFPTQALYPQGFDPQVVRASADGSAAYVRSVSSALGDSFFFGMEEQATYVSSELNAASTIAWAYDDLLIASGNETLTAFTPASP